MLLGFLPWWPPPDGSSSDFAIASSTRCWISSKSGSPVSTSGGTNETVVSGSSLARSARSTKRSSSVAGMSVLSSCLLASAISWTCSSTCCGLSCCSMALITHFCRAIRE